MKVMFFKFQRFSGGFECVLVQLLLIQALFSVQLYIRMKVILSSIRSDAYFVCRVNRFRIMFHFLRDGSACPVFCKTLPFSGLMGRGGGGACLKFFRYLAYPLTCFFAAMETDNSESHEFLTMRKLCFFKWVFTTQLTVYGTPKCESHRYF